MNLLNAAHQKSCASQARMHGRRCYALVINYFASCTKAMFAGCTGIDLKALPARSCCWSSTLFSHDAKLTLRETMAVRMVRVIEMMSCTLDMAPIPPNPDI